MSHWDCRTEGTADMRWYLWDRGSLRIPGSHWDCMAEGIPDTSWYLWDRGSLKLGFPYPIRTVGWKGLQTQAGIWKRKPLFLSEVSTSLLNEPLLVHVFLVTAHLYMIRSTSSRRICVAEVLNVLMSHFILSKTTVFCSANSLVATSWLMVQYKTWEEIMCKRVNDMQMIFMNGNGCPARNCTPMP